MKQIPLTRGLFALVDDEDYELLNNFKWNAGLNGGINYAYHSLMPPGKRRTLSMHRIVMGVGTTDGNIHIDHINHNGIDNRKCNLRICTKSQNAMNMKNKPKGSSIYRGVFFDKHRNTWVSQIMFNYKQNHIGRYKTEIEAALEYDKKALELFGEFANLNFKLNTSNQ